MRRDPGPLFVERKTYRRRRMVDAARLLPILGVVLFAMPTLWGGPDTSPVLTAHVMTYLFGIWVLLCVLGAALSAYLSAREPGEDSEEV